MNKLKEIIEFAVERGFVWDKEEFPIPAVPDNWPEVYLFNHDFAKAVFGRGYDFAWSFLNKHKRGSGKKLAKKLGLQANWQYYLQQAVINKDPRGYYYKYIKNHE